MRCPQSPVRQAQRKPQRGLPAPHTGSPPLLALSSALPQGGPSWAAGTPVSPHTASPPERGETQISPDETLSGPSSSRRKGRQDPLRSPQPADHHWRGGGRFVRSPREEDCPPQP